MELRVWIGKKVEDDQMLVDEQIDDQNMCRLIEMFIDFIKENNIFTEEPMKPQSQEKHLESMSQVAGRHSIWAGEVDE